MSNSDNISFLNSESWGNVGGEGLVSLLESVVLLNVMQVVSSDDNGSSHLGGHNHTLEDLSSDIHI